MKRENKSSDEIKSETGETGETVENGDLSEFAADLISEMPEPSDHAIEKEKQNRESAEADTDNVIDGKKEVFNSDIHQVDKDGKPKISPTTGRYLKKRGRKKGLPNASTVSRVGGLSQYKQDPGQEAMTAQASVSGKSAANLLMTLGVVIGGDDWQPMKDAATGLDEKAMLEKAFADYILATGKTDIPPGWALTIAVGAYALPRFTMEKTRQRSKNLITKIKIWWLNRKSKSTKATENEQDD